MENKRNLVIGLVIVAIVAGSGITAIILLMPPAGNPPPEESLLPTTPVPSVTLSVNDVVASEENSITLQEIVTMLQADESKIRSWVYPIGTVNRTIVGFNPIDMLDQLGYWDAFNLLCIAGDAFSRTINTTDLYLRDSAFTSDWMLDPIFIGIACDGQWFTDSPIQSVANYGNFSIFGQTRTSAQRIKNLVTMNITQHWQVAVKVNGVTEFVIDRANVTVNEYTDRYSYSDNATGKSWDNTFTGRTVADIVNRTTAKDLSYNVTFLAADGWGTTWKYNKSEIQDGLPPSTCAMIGTPPQVLGTDGLLCTLYYKIAPAAGTPSFNRLADGGPFRAVVPGQTRNRYMKLVVEILITAV